MRLPLHLIIYIGGAVLLCSDNFPGHFRSWSFSVILVSDLLESFMTDYVPRAEGGAESADRAAEGGISGG